MSDNPPPPPPPPADGPLEPYRYPPGYEPPKSGGNGARIAIGVGLAFALPTVLGLLGTLLSQVSPDLGGISFGLVAPLMLLVPIGLLFSAKTRYVGIGMLITYAVVVVLAAGACVVLLAGLGY